MSEATRKAQPDIPWAGIIGTRNALAHEYGAVDYRRLHAVVKDGVPRLVAILERLMPE